MAPNFTQIENEIVKVSAPVLATLLQVVELAAQKGVFDPSHFKGVGIAYDIGLALLKDLTEAVAARAAMPNDPDTSTNH